MEYEYVHELLKLSGHYLLEPTIFQETMLNGVMNIGVFV